MHVWFLIRKTQMYETCSHDNAKLAWLQDIQTKHCHMGVNAALHDLHFSGEAIFLTEFRANGSYRIPNLVDPHGQFFFIIFKTDLLKKISLITAHGRNIIPFAGCIAD